MQLRRFSSLFFSALVVAFAAGIFSGEILAAQNSTPTSFHRTVTIPKSGAGSYNTNRSNNEDSFFDDLFGNDRQSARAKRQKDRNRDRRDAKVNAKGEEEARTQELHPVKTKGRRQGNRDIRARKAAQAQKVNDASSNGANE